jgi:simple sugar transport system permease protein
MIELLMFATPLILAASGETLGQKAGVINIGLEGVMLVAAYFAALASLSTGSPWLGMVAGASAGMLLNLISSGFTIKLGADQVVVGTAVNLLALGLTGTLFRAQFGQTGKLFSVPTLPKWHGVDAIMVIGIVLVVVITWLIWRTAYGLALRAVGEYPKAAEAAGFSVHKLRFGASAISGLMGGLGGAYLALGIAGSFAENMTSGRGFIAIAMVTFGRWKPVYVLLACLLIGYLDSLQFVLQAKGWALPFQLFVALPYVVALVVLVIAGRGTMVPAALGRAYVREK